MQLNKDIIHREIAGEHILIPTGETALHYNGIFAITEIGAEIWEMLQNGEDIAAITAELLENYEVEKEVLENDINNFLNMLRENDLLRD